MPRELAVDPAGSFELEALLEASLSLVPIAFVASDTAFGLTVAALLIALCSELLGKPASAPSYAFALLPSYG